MLQNILARVAKEQSFQIDKTLKEREGVFVVVLGGYINEKAILKVADINEGKDFTREIERNKILDSLLLGSSDIINHPKILKSGINEHYNWIIREFVEGESLSGNFGDERYFFGYDVVDDKFINKRDIITTQLVEYLKIAKSIKADKTHEHMSSRYNFDINKYDWALISKKINVDLSNQMDFYKKILAQYSDTSNQSLCFGDLNPGNVLIGENDEVIFSDFEWLCFDNFTFDVAFLWLFLWRYPDWQKYLVDNLISGDKEKEFFRASIIRQIIAYYSGPVVSLEGEKFNQFVNFHRKHWIKYLVACGESFEALMKVKAEV